LVSTEVRVEHELRDAEDGVQRRPHFVTHGPEKRGPRLSEGLGQLEAIPELGAAVLLLGQVPHEHEHRGGSWTGDGRGGDFVDLRQAPRFGGGDLHPNRGPGGGAALGVQQSAGGLQQRERRGSAWGGGGFSSAAGRTEHRPCRAVELEDAAFGV
jgi:hypothetical protein